MGKWRDRYCRRVSIVAVVANAGGESVEEGSPRRTRGEPQPRLAAEDEEMVIAEVSRLWCGAMNEVAIVRAVVGASLDFHTTKDDSHSSNRSRG
jgi:hypothetical protein